MCVRRTKLGEAPFGTRFFSLLLLKLWNEFDMVASRMIEMLLLDVTPYAAAQRIMVFRGKIEIHHRTGWRAFVHVKGQTNGQSHESCAWARHLLLALSTGDWTAEGFNETKWFRKCGDVVHSKSTRIEIIDFLHRQRAPGEEWWVMMALNIVKAVAFLCGMKWLCFAVSVDNAPYSNKMRLPTSNNSQI